MLVFYLNHKMVLHGQLNKMKILNLHAEWEVYSVHGQLLDRGTWWSQSGMRSTLDASAWPSGTLVVVVRHNGSKWAHWVVKE